MPLPPDMIERAARAIAEDNGEDFDRIHRDRAHWKETRGDIAGVWRDVNASTQTDYIEMATGALTAALGDTHVVGSVEAERERCAKIADDARDVAERQASELTYGELYGAQCSADTARDIAAKIRGSQE